MNTRIQYSDFHDVYIYYVEILPSNWENCEHQKYFWNAIVLQEKSQSGVRKLRTLISFWFGGLVRVL